MKRQRLKEKTNARHPFVLSSNLYEQIIGVSNEKSRTEFHLAEIEKNVVKAFFVSHTIFLCSVDLVIFLQIRISRSQFNVLQLGLHLTTCCMANKTKGHKGSLEYRMLDRDQREDRLTAAMGEYADIVFRLTLSQLRSRENAKDIVQETFLALYNCEDQFNNDDHLKAWLMRVAYNKCKNLKRSAYERKEDSRDFSEFYDSLDEPIIFEEHDIENSTAYVWDIVDSLPEDFRSAVHLYYLHGLSVDEVALITDTNPSTIRTRLHRARAKIKELLG